MDKLEIRQQLNRINASLEKEYKEWEPSWKRIAELSRSFRGKFENEKNKEFLRRSDDVIDNVLNDCADTLAAGLQSGLTNPTTRWFKFSLADTDLLNWKPVKTWLYDVENIILTILNKSNFYKLTPTVYKEMGLFGQPCLLHEESPATISRFYAFTVGEYMLATNNELAVDTCFRRFSMTIHQLAAAFGLVNLPTTLQNDYRNGRVANEYNVIHAILPNFMLNRGKMDNKNKPYMSLYYLPDYSASESILRISGYDRFPILAPRWETVSTETYGISPAMHGLGLTKSLQKWHKTRHLGVDLVTRPPMNVPAKMYEDGAAPDLLPGGINIFDERTGPQSVTPTFNVNFDLNNLNLTIADTKENIRTSMFYRLFNAILSVDKRMTATEVDKISSEQMVQLGPVLTNIINEFLSPCLMRVYDNAFKLGAIPPPPPELEGQSLEIEYVSMLAQAQKAVELSASMDFVQFVGAVAQYNPKAINKLDYNELIDDYVDKRGVNPKIIRSTEEVNKMEQAEQAKADQQAMMQQALEGAKTLNEIAPGSLANMGGMQ